MSKVVLDASAVLAVLNREKGSEAIAQLMDDAIIAVFTPLKVRERYCIRNAPLSGWIPDGGL